MENCPDAIKAMEEGNCLFGTVDTWLIWVREGEEGGRMGAGGTERGREEREGNGRERGGKEGGREKGTLTQNNTCTVLMKAGACSSGSSVLFVAAYVLSMFP